MPPETKTPSNAEIDQALKEFEAKSGGQPIQKVSEIPQNEISGKIGRASCRERV